MATITDNDTITLLRGELEGRLIAPGDDRYEEARKVFYVNIDRRPAAIVRPAGAGDVATRATSSG